MSEHVSPKTAEQLREAGLPWEPQVGDWAILDQRPELGPALVVAYARETREPVALLWPSNRATAAIEWCTWLPRADDLLRELAERRGVEVEYNDVAQFWAVRVFRRCSKQLLVYKGHEHLVEALAAAYLAAKEGR